jgi:hypothetical protein
MAAKIGILGETVAVAQATVTVYTVPADKSARVRLLFMAEGGAGNYGYRFSIGMPGTESTLEKRPASGVDVWTGILPSTDQSASDIGVHEISFGGSLVPDAVSKGLLAPMAHDYFLSTGDTVKIEIVTLNLLDHIFQVIGVEDDA